MNCTVCDKPLHPRKNVSGLCRRHALGLSFVPEFDPIRKEALARFQRDHPERVREYCTRASHARLAWCPPEYRDEYRRLTRKKQIPAAEARHLIEEMIATHAKRYRRTGQLQQAA